MTKVKTLLDVMQEIARIVLDRGPDYTDWNARHGVCQYTVTSDHNEQGEKVLCPRCVVGEFWARNGVSEEALETLNEYGSIRGLGDSGVSVPVPVTRRAFEFLALAQRFQDEGYEYGSMLARAVHSIVNTQGLDDTTEYVV